jgi:hypothetical protein
MEIVLFGSCLRASRSCIEPMLNIQCVWLKYHKSTIYTKEKLGHPLGIKNSGVISANDRTRCEANNINSPTANAPVSHDRSKSCFLGGVLTE